MEKTLCTICKRKSSNKSTNVFRPSKTNTTTFGTINTNTSRGENSATATTNTIGVNWILNPNARVIFNYAETKFGNKVTYLSTTPADVGFTSKERVASVRTQLNF
jgi:phosphate-selective porin